MQMETESLRSLRPRANVDPINFEIGAWMELPLLQLNSTPINWLDPSIGSTRQVGKCNSGSAFQQTPP